MKFIKTIALSFVMVLFASMVMQALADDIRYTADEQRFLDFAAARAEAQKAREQVLQEDKAQTPQPKKSSRKKKPAAEKAEKPAIMLKVLDVVVNPEKQVAGAVQAVAGAEATQKVTAYQNALWTLGCTVVAYKQGFFEWAQNAFWSASEDLGGYITTKLTNLALAAKEIPAWKIGGTLLGAYAAFKCYQRLPEIQAGLKAVVTPIEKKADEPLLVHVGEDALGRDIFRLGKQA